MHGCLHHWGKIKSISEERKTHNASCIGNSAYFRCMMDMRLSDDGLFVMLYPEWYPGEETPDFGRYRLLGPILVLILILSVVIPPTVSDDNQKIILSSEGELYQWWNDHEHRHIYYWEVDPEWDRNSPEILLEFGVYLRKRGYVWKGSIQFDSVLFRELLSFSHQPRMVQCWWDAFATDYEYTKGSRPHNRAC